jgi:hypothetical protein
LHMRDGSRNPFLLPAAGVHELTKPRVEADSLRSPFNLRMDRPPGETHFG